MFLERRVQNVLLLVYMINTSKKVYTYVQVVEQKYLNQNQNMILAVAGLLFLKQFLNRSRKPKIIVMV